mgnify:CR=1 FL=1
METETTVSVPEKRHLGGLQIFLIVLATMVVTVGVTWWVLRTYIFPAEFRPVELSAKEEQVLNAKLERLDTLQTRRTRGTASRSRMCIPTAPTSSWSARRIRGPRSRPSSWRPRWKDLDRIYRIDKMMCF